MSPQHRQVRRARNRRQDKEGLGPSQRGDARRFRRTIRKCRPPIGPIGQPVIIPGDMGRASWVLVGQPGSMEQTFGTTCHGAGRAMSRTAAVKDATAAASTRNSKHAASSPRQSLKGLAEEQPKAYKDVDEVVDVVHRAGLSKKVARMRPLGVIKG